MRHKMAAGLGARLIAGLVLAIVMRVVPVSAAKRDHVLRVRPPLAA